jgi:hypothetical protein
VRLLAVNIYFYAAFTVRLRDGRGRRAIACMCARRWALVVPAHRFLAISDAVIMPDASACYRLGKRVGLPQENPMRLFLCLLLAAALCSAEPQRSPQLKEAEAAAEAYIATVLKVAHRVTDVEPPLTDEQRKELAASEAGKKYMWWQAARRHVNAIDNGGDLVSRTEAATHLMNKMYGLLRATPPVAAPKSHQPVKVRGRD